MKTPLISRQQTRKQFWLNALSSVLVFALVVVLFAYRPGQIGVSENVVGEPMDQEVQLSGGKEEETLARICTMYLDYDPETKPLGLSVTEVKKCVKCQECAKKFMDKHEETKDGGLDYVDQIEICKKARGNRRQLGFFNGFVDGVCNAVGWVKSDYYHNVQEVTLTKTGDALTENELKALIEKAEGLLKVKSRENEIVLGNSPSADKVVLQVNCASQGDVSKWNAEKLAAFSTWRVTGIANVEKSVLRLAVGNAFLPWTDASTLTTLVNDLYNGNGAVSQDQKTAIVTLMGKGGRFFDRHYDNNEALGRGMLGDLLSKTQDERDIAAAPAIFSTRAVQLTINNILLNIKTTFAAKIDTDPSFNKQGRDAIIYSSLWEKYIKEKTLKQSIQGFAAPEGANKEYVPLIFDMALYLKRINHGGENQAYKNFRAEMMAPEHGPARFNEDSNGKHSFRNPNELSDWVKLARTKGYGVEAGPSATTGQVLALMRFINHLAVKAGKAPLLVRGDFVNFCNAAWAFWQTEALRSMSPVHTRYEVMDVCEWNLWLFDRKDKANGGNRNKDL